jgi:hypothetical protein
MRVFDEGIDLLLRSLGRSLVVIKRRLHSFCH